MLKLVECMIGIISDGCIGRLNQVEPIEAKEGICRTVKPIHPLNHAAKVHAVLERTICVMVLPA